MRFVDTLPSLLLLELRKNVLLSRNIGLLAAQLEIAFEAVTADPAIRDRGLHGTAGFRLMFAVTETAIGRERFDFIEDLRDRVAGIPQLQFAHTGRVDQHSTTRQNEQPPRGRRMPAA